MKSIFIYVTMTGRDQSKRSIKNLASRLLLTMKRGAEANDCAQGKVEKPVWRLAFFSRLEERKGLKVFVRAVRELLEAAAGKLDQRFEVIFVGADARIDMRSSSDWLKAKTASWK